jgi:hypothetical protein
MVSRVYASWRFHGTVETMSSNTPIPSLGSPPASANDFQVYTYAGAVRFLQKAVQPPSQVYVELGDQISISSATSQVGETVTVSYRLLRFDGEIVLGQFQISPPSNRSVSSYTEPLTEGFLLSVSCKATVATTRGQTFVRIFLSNLKLGQGQPSYMLMADYVTNQMAPAYPGGRVLAPSEGPGNITTIAVANPAPGSNFQIPIPANARWRVVTIVGTFVTSAVVSNRKIFFYLFSAGMNVWSTYVNQVIPANTTTFAAAAAVSAGGALDTSSINAPLPPNAIILPVAHMGVLTIGIDVADQWSSCATQVEEWLDNV